MRRFRVGSSVRSSKVWPLRLVVVLVAVLGLTVVSPLGAVPPGGHFPAGWLNPVGWLDLLRDKVAWASPDLGPRQLDGLRVDREHYATTSQTRAQTGAGRDAGGAPGALPAETPRQESAPPAAGTKPWTTPATPTFDPATSRAMPERADGSSQTYRNVDGSYTRRVSGGPVNFKAPDGSWKPIDTRLVDRARRYRMAAHDVDVSLAHTGTASSTKDALVSVALPTGQTFSYGLAGAAPVAATVKDSTATYPSILPETDLELATNPSQLKETIILRSPAAANSWDFPLDLKGLKPSMKDGSVIFTDGGGKEVGWIPGGFMSDSKFDPERGDYVSSSDVKYELVTVAGGPTLRVTAGRAWLNDPARVYPVKVDPTFGFYVQDDVFVDNDTTTPAQQNGQDLTVGTYDDGAHVARSFLNISNFGPNGMTGRGITGARLKLFLSWTYDCNHVTPVDVWWVAEPWTVSGLANSGLWGPAVYGPAIGGASPVDNTPACTNNNPVCRCVGEWMTIHLSPDAFNYWSLYPSTNYGLALIARTEGGPNTKFGWKRFSSRNYSDGSLGPVIEFDYNDVAPQINAQYPPNNYAATSLTPELTAEAVDPDNWPHQLSKTFMVYDKNLTKIADSGPITAYTGWFVPSGILKWNEAYFWTVIASDGFGASSSQTMNMLRTPVPQPVASSTLSQNGGQGFDTNGVGNYTTSALDVQVPTVGPELAVRRSFNSLDTRRDPAFGVGWSSIIDMRIRDPYHPLDGNARILYVRYPNGQDVGFGKNADGTYSPAPGRFATLTRLTNPSGYQLVDKDGTTYTFLRISAFGEWHLSSIKDSAGRTMTFQGFCDASCTTTSIVSASGRRLSLTWAGGIRPKIAAITTDPAVPGDPSTAATWTYTYAGNLLDSVCPPGTTTACTRYTYSSVPVRQSRVLNSAPVSYWRLSETSGTSAASAVIENSGTDAATYSNVTLGQAGPLPGGSPPAAGFNGTNSALILPSSFFTTGARFSSVSLWFKTTTAGVLLGEANQPWNSATVPTQSHTPLYVGTDGKLHSGWYIGSTGVAAQIISYGTVTDGNWHNVVLNSDGVRQSMYLDGFAEQDTMQSPLPGVINHMAMQNLTVGAGYSSGALPVQPAAGWRSFNGTIADVAIWDRPLNWPDIQSMRDATSAGLTSSIRPSGAVDATVVYNPASGTVTQVVDAAGGTWQPSKPVMSGSYRVHAGTVLGASPADYWRLAETGTTQAINEVNGNVATYNSVTLGVAGGPFDDPARTDDNTTVASFNGTSSRLVLPSQDVPATGPQSVSAWFKLPAGGSGVILGYQTSPAGTQSTAGWVPAIYVGTDGKLRGEFWNGSVNPATTTGTVNDNAWHHVSLTATTNKQVLYVDGAKVGQLDGTLVNFGALFAQVGAGQWNTWPGAGASALSYWPGQLAEVSYYRAELTPVQVAAQAAARQKSAGAAVKTITVTDPGNQTVRYVLDAATGRKVAEIDQLGKVTTFGYDTGGYLRAVTDPNGNVTTTEHDVRGNTIAQKTCQKLATGACSTVFFTFYPDATTRQLTPDPRNDVMLTMRDGRSSSSTDDTYKTTYVYDTLGRKTSVTDPLGRVTTTAFTTATTPAFGGGTTPPALPRTVTTPGGAVQTVEYYASGDVATVTDPAGKVTTFTYDGRGRVATRTETTTIFPAGLTTSFTYDAVGHIRTQTAPAVTNRVTGAIHTAVTTTVYNVDGQELTQTVTDETGGDAARTLTWTYNNHGQRNSETDAAGETTTVEFDAYGRLFRQIAPDGAVTESSFDAKGQLLTTTVKGYVGDPNAPATPHDLVLTSRAYDPAGRLASETDAMGWQTLYAYTDNNLLAEVRRKDPVSGATFLQRQDTFDAAGNLVSRKTNDGRTTTNYQVDQAGRTLKSTVDPAGVNRSVVQTYSPDNFVTSSRVLDGANQLISGSEATYDTLGRPTSTSVLGDGTGGTAGWWKLNETSGLTAADASGNNRTATASTAAVTWGEGGAVVNGAGLFTTPGPVLNTAQSYTVSAWVKLRSTANYFTAVGQGGTNFGAFFLQYGPGAGYRLVMGNADVASPSAFYAAQTGNAAPALNVWTHLVGTLDTSSGALKLYVNGAQAGTGTNPTPWNGTGQFTIGGIKYNGTASNLFDGSVDNVQVFQRALSPGEAATLYSRGRDGGSVPSKLTTTYQLDSSGLVRSSTDPNGNTTDYGLDEAGRVAVVTKPAVATEVGGGSPVLTRPVSYNGYDTFGSTTESKDANGNVAVTAYDAAGRVVSTTSPSYLAPGGSTGVAAVSTRAYDDAGLLSVDTDAMGHETHYAYDQLGRLSSTTAADGGVTKYTHDLVGDRLSATDPTGAKTTATFDYLGRTLTSTDEVRQTSASYTTNYTYGPGGWVSSVRSPGNVTSSTTYNNVGEPVTSMDGAGKVTSFQYDAAGRRIRATVPDGTYSTNTFDLAGRLTTQRSYDAANALLTTRSTVYDAVGNPTAATDARGTTSTFVYDATGLLTSQTQPISGSDAINTSFGYDAAGHQTRFTDGRGSPFLTTYNAWGRPESRIEPATSVYSALPDRTFTNVYDLAGRLATRTEPGGVSVAYTYDVMGRMTGQTGAGAEVATTARTFGYDAAGRVTSFSAPGGDATLTYDDRGLLLSAAGGPGSSMFTYTPDRRMASRVDGAGTTAYTYDPAGRLATVANTTSAVAATFAYNDLSQVNKVTYGTNGNARSFGYDSQHRLTADELKTPGGASIAKIAYGWDANGNETSKTTTGFAGASTNTYTYDQANRLTQWDNGTSPTLYAYDKSGNRVQAGTKTFTYDERNQLKTADANLMYSYTPRGTLSAVSNLGTSTVYTEADAFGQVRTQYTTPTAQKEYDYDAAGRLVRPGTSYSGLGNTLADDGTASYTRDPGGALMGTRSGTTNRLVWTDRHVDVVGQFDATAATLGGSTTYDPLGKVLTTASMQGNLGYQSEYSDPDTGRVNMLSRWYNTDTGAFDTRDSVDVSAAGNSMRANRFAYADGNPMTNIDPTGHCSWYDVVCGVSKAAAVVSTAAKTVWNATTTAYNAAKDWVVDTYNSAKNWVVDKYNQVKNWVTEKVTQVKNYVVETAAQIKQRAEQTLQTIKQAAKDVIAVGARVIVNTVNTVKDAYQKTEQWIVEHKDILIEAAAVVGSIAAGIACTAVTAGVGAVACMVGAAALINLAKDYGQGNIQNIGDIFQSAGVGAVQGLFGAVGGIVGGKIVTGLASKLGSGLMARIGAGAVGGGIAEGASGAGIDAATQLITTGRVDARQVLNAGLMSAATGGATGGAFGGFFRGGRGCNSFTPLTRVLMADGSTKPIAEVGIGDKVAATDPETGVTSAKPVSMLHLNRDQDLTNVQVASASAKAPSMTSAKARPVAGPVRRAVVAATAVMAAAAAVTTINTTQEHPFWDASTRTWTNASELKPGQATLATPDGSQVKVLAVDNFTGRQDMYNLTVDDTHTYYVLAGDTPVLVHNTGPAGNGDVCRIPAGQPGAGQFAPSGGPAPGQPNANGMLNGTNATGQVTSRGNFRVDTVDNAWASGTPGTSGGVSCPRGRANCAGEVFRDPVGDQPGADLGHWPESWTNREFPVDVTRPDVLDDYQDGVRVECQPCSRGAGNREDG